MRRPVYRNDCDAARRADLQAVEQPDRRVPVFVSRQREINNNRIGRIPKDLSQVLPRTVQIESPAIRGAFNTRARSISYVEERTWCLLT